MYTAIKKTSSLQTKLCHQKNILAGSNFDLSCLTLLPPYMGWDIMGYASEPLTHHICLRNLFYALNLKFLH